MICLREGVYSTDLAVFLLQAVAEETSMANEKNKNTGATDEIGSQLFAMAEQIGRMAGTIEGNAEAWLNRSSITDQLTRVRDTASQMLDRVSGGMTQGREAARQ